MTFITDIWFLNNLQGLSRIDPKPGCESAVCVCGGGGGWLVGVSVCGVWWWWVCVSE